VNAQAWVTLGVGIAALTVAFWGLRQARRVRLRQFEQLYIQRFWHLVDALSPNARFGKSGVISDRDRLTVLSYLELCEDELELRSAGWITDALWRERRATILRRVGSWPVRNVWNEQKGSGKFRELNRFMDYRGNYDPCRFSRFTKWWMCLYGNGA
jgi:hypothetical protein